MHEIFQLLESNAKSSITVSDSAVEITIGINFLARPIAVFTLTVYVGF